MYDRDRWIKISLLRKERGSMHVIHCEFMEYSSMYMYISQWEFNKFETIVSVRDSISFSISSTEKNEQKLKL